MWVPGNLMFDKVWHWECKLASCGHRSSLLLFGNYYIAASHLRRVISITSTIVSCVAKVSCTQVCTSSLSSASGVNYMSACTRWPRVHRALYTRLTTRRQHMYTCGSRWRWWYHVLGRSSLSCALLGCARPIFPVRLQIHSSAHCCMPCMYAGLALHHSCATVTYARARLNRVLQRWRQM